MAWHPDATPVLIRSKLGFVLKGGVHRRPVVKLLWHTTEGGSAAGAFGAYRRRAGMFSGVHPHFTYDPVRDRLYQHIDTDRASYSLKSGDLDGVIQVEIVGRAGESHTWPPVINERLGVLAGWVFDQHPGIDRRDHRPFLGAGAGLLAAPYPRGKARMSPREWATFSGTCGHQHAPGDDHWDPGALDIDAVLTAANPTRLPIPATSSLEDQPDMIIANTASNWQILVFPDGSAFACNTQDGGRQPDVVLRDDNSGSSEWDWLVDKLKSQGRLTVYS